MKGLVTSVHRKGFYVQIDEKQEFCIVNNSFKGQGMPVVGDNVTIRQEGDKFLVLDIIERKNFISRYDHHRRRYQGFAANIDLVTVITSATAEFSTNRIRRFLSLPGDQEINKLIVLTKGDLLKDSSDIDTYIRQLREEFPETSVLAINAKDETQVRGITKYWNVGQAALLLGSSGVGKTTIINTLCGLDLRVDLTLDQSRLITGRHTTSSRNMYFTKCGRRIIDGPGIKIIGLDEQQQEQFDRHNPRQLL